MPPRSLILAVFLAGCNADTASDEPSDEEAAEDSRPRVFKGEQPETAPTQPPAFMRKSATEMSDEEIEIFKRGFQAVIDSGVMDQFAIEHYDYMSHRHHGALLKTESVESVVGSDVAIHRFLSWHRAFLSELENAMRTQLALTDPEAAERVFLPYWDWSHTDQLPAWVELDQWKPTGVKAIAVEGLPDTHPGYGIAGQLYEVDLRRWPGTMDLAPTLPSPEHLEKILAKDDYDDFTRYVDFTAMITVDIDKGEIKALVETLAEYREVHGVGVLQDVLSSGENTKDTAGKVLSAMAGLSMSASGTAEHTEVSPQDAAALLGEIIKIFPLAPHGNAHLWAGGENPDNPDERGTVTYFSELVIDPVFWMLHAELDRVWYTWERQHGGGPELEGDDTMFQPYPQGYYYPLDELTDHDLLSFGYDKLYSP